MHHEGPGSPSQITSQTPSYYYFLQSKQPQRKEQGILALSPHLPLSISIAQQVVCYQLAITAVHSTLLFLSHIHFHIFNNCRTLYALYFLISKLNFIERTCFSYNPACDFCRINNVVNLVQMITYC